MPHGIPGAAGTRGESCMDRLTPGQLGRYLTGGAMALLLIWFGSMILSKLMVAILPLLILILAIGAWWHFVTGNRRR